MRRNQTRQFKLFCFYTFLYFPRNILHFYKLFPPNSTFFFKGERPDSNLAPLLVARATPINPSHYPLGTAACWRGSGCCCCWCCCGCWWVCPPSPPSYSSSPPTAVLPSAAATSQQQWQVVQPLATPQIQACSKPKIIRLTVHIFSDLHPHVNHGAITVTMIEKTYWRSVHKKQN